MSAPPETWWGHGGGPQERWPDQGQRGKTAQGQGGPRQPGTATKAPPGVRGSLGLKVERTARQMPRPTGKSKLDSKFKNPPLPRARMVQLPQPKRRLRTRSLKRTLLREPGKSQKPRPLLPLRTVGPRRYLYLEDRGPQGPKKTWHACQGLVTQRDQ